MSSEAESTKSDDEDFSCGLLLRDIEEISKALYLHKSPHEAFNSSCNHQQNVVAKTGSSESNSDVIIQDPLHKDKKSSIWKWKPLKALTHIRNHRFNCCFFLHVHAIEGLPPNFNNLDLCVTWKRKTDISRTRPARVCLGMAEFGEILMHRCTVFVGRSGPHSSAKYEPKLFLLQASVIGAPTLDIGSRWIDLSRLLPLTLEEFEGDRASSGLWTTSFNLTGKAKGAMLNVSFGYSILNGNSFGPGYFLKVPDIVRENELNHFADFDTSSRSRTSQLQNLGSILGISTGGSYFHSQSANSNFIQEMHPKQGSELSKSVSLLYQKFDDGKMGDAMGFNLCNQHLASLKPKSDPTPESSGAKTGYEFNEPEFDVIEQGVEVSMKNQLKLRKSTSQIFGDSVIETIDIAEIFAGDDTEFDEYDKCHSKLAADNNDEPECASDDPEHRDNHTCITEPSFQELDSDLYNFLTSKQDEVNTLSLDDVEFAESIENDFLNMLGIGQCEDDISVSAHDTPSDLLTLFEEAPLAWGNSIIDSDEMAKQRESCRSTPTAYKNVAFADDFDLSLGIQAVKWNESSVNQSFRNKRDAEMLENLETEALMHEWGLNEKAFQYSTCVSSGGFGSPVYIPEEEPLKLPSIEHGLGPIIQTKGGGFLRSMNPLLFRNANNGARLIVQVSAPVVLPSAMGLTVLEMLECWASLGVEKMCVQANELMPLEDFTGKTIRQVIAEANSRSDASSGLALEQESDDGVESNYEKKPDGHNIMCSFSSSEDIDSDYVSGKDLVPMAITNIEGLLVEGLKIQSGMPHQEPPSSIRIQLGGNSAKASELSSNFMSERASGLQVLNVNELIKYSLSLEEWVRLDSGEIYVEDDNREHISELFAAHCAKSAESGSPPFTWEDETMKLLGKDGGVFPDNFTMGLKVQLRDPLRNHEMVGSSMLALVQVGRVYSAKQPEVAPNEQIIQEGADLDENETKIFQAMFKVSEAHLAGPNVLRGNKQVWGTSRQHQSGSRWLLSSGVAKPKKNLVSNSKAVIRSSSGLTRQAFLENVLWSISFPIQGKGDTWNDQVALNVHVRNPDIIFPTESVK